MGLSCRKKWKSDMACRCHPCSFTEVTALGCPTYFIRWKRYKIWKNRNMLTPSDFDYLHDYLHGCFQTVCCLGWGQGFLVKWFVLKEADFTFDLSSIWLLIKKKYPSLLLFNWGLLYHHMFTDHVSSEINSLIWQTNAYVVNRCIVGPSRTTNFRIRR